MAAVPARQLAAGPVAVLLATGSAWAEPVGPGLWADVSVEFETEYTFLAQDPELELSDTFATVESEFGFAFDDKNGLRASLTLEPVTDPESDRIFEDFGLYAEEVYVYGTLGKLEVIAGKFNPWFDLATDYAPGLYGDDLAGDYELTERLGGAISVPFEVADAQHSLTVSAFMADRTPLSDSLFTSRGRIDAADGGPSNTDYPQSVTAALTGRSGSTIYNLAARYQAAGAADEKDETGIVAGIAHEALIAGTETLLFGEIGHFKNFDGESDPVTFATFATEVGLGAVALTAALGLADAHEAPARHLATASLEVELADDLTAEAGYRFLHDDGIASHTVSFLLTFQFGIH